MDARQAEYLKNALGIKAAPPLPSINDSLKAIVAGLKELGEEGLTGAQKWGAEAHLAAIASGIKLQVEQRKVADKVDANNLAEAKAQADKAARDKALRAETSGTLGNLA